MTPTDASPDLATPRPWRVKQGKRIRLITPPPEIVGADGSTVACFGAGMIGFENRAVNAPLTIAAVNSYASHRAALEACVESMDAMIQSIDELAGGNDSDWHWQQRHLPRQRAAIAALSLAQSSLGKEGANV